MKNGIKQKWSFTVHVPNLNTTWFVNDFLSEAKLEELKEKHQIDPGYI